MNRFISKMDFVPLLDEEECMQFLYDEGLLRTHMYCSVCHALLHPVSRGGRKFEYFSCRKGHDQFSRSVAVGTWFEETKLKPLQVLLLTHCFVHQASYAIAKVECSLDDKILSNRTVSDWYRYCRNVCMTSNERKFQNKGKIGGTGHIVEIDECQIWQGKDSHGRVSEGDWILGMIDTTTNEVRMEVCNKVARNAVTLFSLIERQVELTSTVITDCWGGYTGALGEGFVAHLSVYYSANSGNPVRNENTSNIQSQWRSLRQRLCRRGIRREEIYLHLAEFLWRRDCMNRSADPFQEFMEDVRLRYPVL